MPYEKEFAGSKGLTILLKDQKLKEMLKVVQFIKTDTEYDRIDDYVVPSQKMNPEKVKQAIVIDGSKIEVPYIEGSMASLAIFNINQCIVDIKNVKDYLSEKFPHPSMYDTIKQHKNVLFFTPLKGMETEEFNESEFFRFVVFEHLKQLKNPILDWVREKGHVLEQEETIFETFVKLAENGKGNIRNIPCPCPVCRKAGKGVEFKDFYDKVNDVVIYKSNCRCNIDEKPLFITDLLGFHALLTNENGYEALTTQIMLVMEKLILLNTLRNLVLNDLESIINESAFIVDGNLGFFSHASWLTTPVVSEIADIKSKADLLLFSVEKSGQFLNHLKQVNDNYNLQYSSMKDYGYAENRFEDPSLKNGMMFFLDDDYIKRYIKNFDEAGGFYGENNYFGKKVFYKNKNGGLFVINLAFEDERDKSLCNGRNTPERIAEVKRVEDMTMLMDNFASQEYANAISLLSMANEGAALSSSYMSKQLVDEFVRSCINNSNSSVEKDIEKAKTERKQEVADKFNLDENSLFNISENEPDPFD